MEYKSLKAKCHAIYGVVDAWHDHLANPFAFFVITNSSRIDPSTWDNVKRFTIFPKLYKLLGEHVPDSLVILFLLLFFHLYQRMCIWPHHCSLLSIVNRNITFKTTNIRD
ncbi:hypothetical protein CDAR_111991 [Caerostris darwini]|uniref:Uncharacterized protein n=1 Tax=Caerostris darwini TaxID=1538125 RepID=A0AAV4QTI7_9ARAC|nr:hypothetical protein CDAR_111991 [Caerostris darwini]